MPDALSLGFDTSAAHCAAALVMGDRLLVNNDGSHPLKEGAGVIQLEAGYHPLQVEFFEGAGLEGLEVLVSGPDFNKQTLGADQLFHLAPTKE